MKYFTPEWWASSETSDNDIEDTLNRYRAYWNSIVESLPKAIVELESTYTLHDSEVRRIACDLSKQEVEIGLNGWDRELSNKIQYTLRYKGVTLFEQNIPDTESYRTGYGDLGYWEYEKLPKLIEMRILFVSHTEICIRFSDFEFTHRLTP